MEVTREPYELLVRWIPDGLPENQYAGTFQAQINFAMVVRENGVVTMWQPDPKGPFHVALDGGDGIKLDDFMPQLNAAAIAELATKSKELDEAKAEVNQIKAEAEQLKVTDATAASTGE